MTVKPTTCLADIRKQLPELMNISRDEAETLFFYQKIHKKNLFVGDETMYKKLYEEFPTITKSVFVEVFYADLSGFESLYNETDSANKFHTYLLKPLSESYRSMLAYYTLNCITERHLFMGSDFAANSKA